MDAVYTNRDLNRFWLHLLAENTLSVYNALSPREADLASRIKKYADRLDALTLRADTGTDAGEPALNKDALQAAQDLRKFLIYILDRKTTEDLHLDLKVSTINSFVSQTEKYMDALDSFIKNKKPVYDPVEEEVFWLDIFFHQCSYISDNLGNFQKRYSDKAQELADTISQFWFFSVELQGIIYRMGDQYTHLADEHHLAVNNVLNELYEFTSTIILLHRQGRIPGSLSLLYLGRMQRMVCFFLLQSAKFIHVTPPGCDPYAPRISRY